MPTVLVNLETLVLLSPYKWHIPFFSPFSLLSIDKSGLDSSQVHTWTHQVHHSLENLFRLCLNFTAGLQLKVENYPGW